MATVKNFNRATLKTIRADIDKALAAVAKQHGIDLGIGTIRFESTSFRTTLTASIKSTSTASAKSEPTNVNPTWVANFKKYAVMFGLKETDLNKQIKYRGKTLTIVGIRPKANAPLVLQRVTGGCVAVSAESVISALK
jgi:hypothetical protein